MSKDHDKGDTDKVAQDWLSRKSGEAGKEGGVDYYAMEKFRREDFNLSPDDIRHMVSDPDSPYSRIYREPINLNLLHECLVTMHFTGEPLPCILVDHLLNEIELLKTGRESDVFQRRKNPVASMHERSMRMSVVNYVELTKAHDLDKNPMKTIKEELGITRSTYYEWKKKHPQHPFPLVSTENIDDVKEYVQCIWETLVAHYKPPK